MYTFTMSGETPSIPEYKERLHFVQNKASNLLFIWTKAETIKALFQN